MLNSWFVRLGDKEFGPLTASQLLQLARQRRMTHESLVRQGSAGPWFPAACIPDLFPQAITKPAGAGAQAAVPASRPLLPGPNSPHAIPGAGQLVVRAPIDPGAVAGVAAAHQQRRPNHSAAAFWGVASSIGVLVIGLSLLLLSVFVSREAPQIAEDMPQPDSPSKASLAPEKPLGAANTAKKEVPKKEEPLKKPDREPRPEDREPRRAAPEPAPDSTAAGRALATDEIARIADPSIALIRGKRVSATGFLIRKKVLATNYHVVKTEFIKDISVEFPTAPMEDRGPYTATLLYEDPERDLAFLAVNTDLPPLLLAEDQPLPRGQRIVVIGNTGTGGDTLSNAIAEGTMSTEKTFGGIKYWQTNVSGAGPGNSGGPVLNPQGRVIGVLTADLADPEDPQKRRPGLNLCIPITDLHVALGRLDSMTDEQRNHTAGRHEVGVVYHFARDAGDHYAAILKTFVQFGDEAMNKGTRYYDVRLLGETRQKVIDARSRFDKQFDSVVSIISVDHRLSTRVHERFNELWTNLREMKKIAEDPGDLGGRYWVSRRAQLTEATDQHDRILESLRLELGFK